MGREHPCETCRHYVDPQAGGRECSMLDLLPYCGKNFVAFMLTGDNWNCAGLEPVKVAGSGIVQVP